MSADQGLWRRAGPGDVAAVRRFLAPRETYATGLSGRLLGADGGLRLPKKPGALYLLQTAYGGVQAAVLLPVGGSAFPVFADGACADGVARSANARSYRPSACAGRADHVDALEAALRWEPILRIRYRVMTLDAPDFTPGADGTARPARASDLDALCPLAEAYEREEVLTPIHRFDADGSRAAQARSLDRHIVYLAEADGLVVARAQTNARGYTRDQIGGVYVRPDYRRHGYGRIVVTALARDRLAAGRGLSLFVKEANPAAIGLYLALGFKDAGSYRVDYFV
ncbi:MAG: GNAT family N-acetyltransferase [Spirochaetia bacterium]|nr:GNAT family N-acetyltransferase [Spirochaetia bacterium]